MALNPAFAVPNVFVNGTIIDATQMNADFSAVASWINSNGRQAITSNITFYVSTTGQDVAGAGMSAANPAASLGFVYNTLVTQFAFLVPGVSVTIQFAAGTYNAPQIVSGLCPGQLLGDSIQIVGNPTTPTSVVFAGDPAFECNQGASCHITGITFQSVSDGIYCGRNANLTMNFCNFGPCTAYHMHCERGGQLGATDAYTISGGARAHVNSARSGSHVFLSNLIQDAIHGAPSPGPAVTISGNPVWGNGFLQCVQAASVYMGGFSWTGTAGTGPQYTIQDNGTVFTNTGGTLVLPGNAAGVLIRGGQYY